MSKAHDNDASQPLIEMHKREERASVLFTPPVVRLFQTFEAREELFFALGDEMNGIPSNIIPYGTLFFKEMVFVFRSRWDDDEEMFYIDVDLATRLEEIGFVFVGDEADEEPAECALQTHH